MGYAQTYEEYIERLRSACPHCQWETIGRSVQGRPIYVVRAVHGVPKATLFITAGQHGNEHIGPEALVKILQWRKPEDVALYIVPVVNPDGFTAWTRQNANHVDLNRNWPEGWGGPGSMPGSCCAICRGDQPLDQPETRSVFGPLTEFKYGFHIDLHSGTEVLAWPPACYPDRRSQYDPLYSQLCQLHRDYASKLGVSPYPCGPIIQAGVDIPPGWESHHVRKVGPYTIYQACGVVNDTVDFRIGRPSVVLEMSYDYNPPYDQVDTYAKRLLAVLYAMRDLSATATPPQYPIWLLALAAVAVAIALIAIAIVIRR